MIRLNKYLAERLGVSRREADLLIENGKIKVNGEMARIGQKAQENDEIVYKGKVLSNTVSFKYIMMNKPVGYVSSRRSQGNAPTLYELLPTEYKKLKTVGRLDKDSSGLILLTNDGDFAYRMTHPKFVKTKIYLVELDRALEPLHQQMIGDFGIELKDGKSKLGLERLDEGRKRWKVIMSEGRNRQIRRTFGALGYTVKELHRVAFGNYQLGSLEPGNTCEVSLK